MSTELDDVRMIIERTCTLGHYVTLVGNPISLINRDDACTVSGCGRKLYTMSIVCEKSDS